MSGNSSTPAASDSNTMLIQLCVKALGSVAPEGMTTKELAAALDKEVKGTPGFDGISSSILSSKLNAIFRRCHGDSPTPTRAQLAELPLTRSQSAEVPRRLVYRYVPADSAELPEAPATPIEGSSSSDESPNLNEPLTPKEDASDRNTFGSAAKKRRVSSGSPVKHQYAADPGTPPEIEASNAPHTELPHKSLEVSKSLEDDLPHKSQAKLSAPAPTRPVAAVSKPSKPDFTQRPMGLNLYYDALGLDAMSAALKQSKASEENRLSSNAAPESADASPTDLDWSDFPSPELLGLHELDGFVC